MQGQPEVYRLHWLIGGSVATLLGLVGLVAELRPPRRDGFLLIQRDELGEVTVSLPGLRRLTEHVGRGIAGVAGVEARPRSAGKGLLLDCRVELAPDSSATTVSNEMREAVGAAIEHHVGTRPKRVDVHTHVGAASVSKKRIQ